MDARARGLLEKWIDSLGRDRRASLYLLLEELCRGMDVSRHNRFGFLRLRAEFETSSELFGCTLEELRDAIADTFGGHPPPVERAPSALEQLRAKVSERGHPDFR
ncbi:MAG: hypothetical protein E6J19_11460 [Chloroflexi bacterium]|nr:MAG: hypothetical protein E6J19_11460 [Chloroflexota bacterium]